MPIDHDYPLPLEDRPYHVQDSAEAQKQKVRDKIYLTPNIVKQEQGLYYFDCAKDPANWTIHGKVLRLRRATCFSNGEGTFGTSMHAPYGSIHYEIIKDEGQDINIIPDNRGDTILQSSRQFSGPYRTPKELILLSDLSPIPLPPIPIAKIGGLDEWLDHEDWGQEHEVIYHLGYLSGGLFPISDNLQSIILKIWESDPAPGFRDEVLGYERIKFNKLSSFGSVVWCYEYDGKKPRNRKQSTSFALELSIYTFP